MRLLKTSLKPNHTMRLMDHRSNTPVQIGVGILLQRAPTLVGGLTKLEKLYYQYRASEDLKVSSSLRQLFGRANSIGDYQHDAGKGAAKTYSHQDLEREPFEALHLAVKRTGDAFWDIPWGPLHDSEDLQSGAMRFISELLGGRSHGASVIGRVPILHYDVTGAKVFVMKSRISPWACAGVIDTGEYDDYAFLTSEELHSRISPERSTQIEHLTPVRRCG